MKAKSKDDMHWMLHMHMTGQLGVSRVSAETPVMPVSDVSPVEQEDETTGPIDIGLRGMS